MIDLGKIKEVAFGLAKGIESLNRRYFLKDVLIGREPRIKVLRGFRGVGKTTSLLQIMGDKAMYFSMDHPAVAEYSLYELGDSFVKAGYNLLLVDEIHYYENWKRDAKALYDEFPHLTMVLSGSAPLAFEPERRYEIIDVDPLSLMEFVHLAGKEIESTESWKDQDETLRFLAYNSWLYEYYGNYMAGGAFPTYFSYKEKTLPSVYGSIRKSVKEDAPFFAKVDGETIRGMERLLLFLGSAHLGEFSLHSLSNTLGLSRHKTYEAVNLLETMKILRLVRPGGEGAKLVRGDPKLMFYHPVLRAAVCDALGVEPNLGALREELAVFSFCGRGWKVSTIRGLKKNPDYLIEKGKERFIVEIGGPSKTRSQLKGFSEKTLIIDDKQLITLALF